MNIVKPMIEIYPNGFKAYSKKRDMKDVMSTLRGE